MSHVPSKVVTLEHIPNSVAKRLKPWQARYISQRVKGLDRRQALAKAGLPDWWRGDRSPEADPIVAAALEECTTILSEKILTLGLVDAVEIHEQLTDEIRGDLADLYSDTGELLPIKEWPLWARQGGVEVTDEPNMVHSADGGGGSWDQVGRKIRIRAGSRQKTIENAMSHKAVDAKAAQKQNIDVQVTVSAEEQREMAAMARRRSKVIDVKAEEA